LSGSSGLSTITAFRPPFDPVLTAPAAPDHSGDTGGGPSLSGAGAPSVVAAAGFPPTSTLRTLAVRSGDKSALNPPSTRIAAARSFEIKISSNSAVPLLRHSGHVAWRYSGSFRSNGGNPPQTNHRRSGSPGTSRRAWMWNLRLGHSGCGYGNEETDLSNQSGHRSRG